MDDENTYSFLIGDHPIWSDCKDEDLNENETYIMSLFYEHDPFTLRPCCHRVNMKHNTLLSRAAQRFPHLKQEIIENVIQDLAKKSILHVMFKYHTKYIWIKKYSPGNLSVYPERWQNGNALVYSSQEHH